MIVLFLDMVYVYNKKNLFGSLLFIQMKNVSIGFATENKMGKFASGKVFQKVFLYTFMVKAVKRYFLSTLLGRI